jgi:ribose/xylose/arabinose/galactoside ABC-type transport system permease subunit
MRYLVAATLWLVARLAPPPVRDALIGDLLEEAALRGAEGGRADARGHAWLLGQLVRSLPPVLVLRVRASAPVLLAVALLPAGTLALTVAVGHVPPGSDLTPATARALILQMAALGLAVALPLLVAEDLDLSVGPVALFGIIYAVAQAGAVHSIAAEAFRTALPVAAAAGLLIGLLNGLLATRLPVPAAAVTFGTGSLLAAALSQTDVHLAVPTPHRLTLDGAGLALLALAGTAAAAFAWSGRSGAALGRGGADSASASAAPGGARVASAGGRHAGVPAPTRPGRWRSRSAIAGAGRARPAAGAALGPGRPWSAASGDAGPPGPAPSWLTRGRLPVLVAALALVVAAAHAYDVVPLGPSGHGASLLGTLLLPLLGGLGVLAAAALLADVGRPWRPLHALAVLLATVPLAGFSFTRPNAGPFVVAPLLALPLLVVLASVVEPGGWPRPLARPGRPAPATRRVAAFAAAGALAAGAGAMIGAQGVRDAGFVSQGAFLALVPLLALVVGGQHVLPPGRPRLVGAAGGAVLTSAIAVGTTQPSDGLAPGLFPALVLAALAGPLWRLLLARATIRTSVADS